MRLKQEFANRWKAYFEGAELPVTFYYTDGEGRAALVEPPSGHQCLIGKLAQVRKGESLSFDVDSIGCSGGKRYTGFSQTIRPQFDYFLSCGIPGKLEGERYKKTPEIVREVMTRMPEFKAPGRFIVFKRWDALNAEDAPEVVIFFAPPDVLSGLFTLTGFDEVDLNAVRAPFGAGCATIVHYPYLEKDAARPRGVLGMFDVSARPFVPKETLSFAVPMGKFVQMVEHMPESFFITESWKRVQRRIH